MEFEAFAAIDGVQYLAVANYYNGGSYNIDSRVSLAASGAYDFDAFAIDGVQYLAVANYYDVSARSTLTPRSTRAASQLRAAADLGNQRGLCF
jgi:hypothetical protein